MTKAMQTQKKSKRTMEILEKDLKRKKKGLFWMGGLTLAVWGFAVLEFFTAKDDAPWYGTLFHLLTPAFGVLMVILCVDFAMKTVTLKESQGVLRVDMARKGAVRAILWALPGCALLTVCFVFIHAAPGILFAAAGFPLGIASGLAVGVRISGKDDPPVDWLLCASLMCGFSVVYLSILTCIAYALGDSYDGHYVLAVFAMPTLLATAICLVKQKKGQK